MAAIPGGIDPDAGPPMMIPLRHFLLALAFLVAAFSVAVADAAGLIVDLGSIGFIHLFLVGWVCVTIMGAMTQFVPVWSGTPLHSQRLAGAQLWLVVVGVSLYGIAWIGQWGWLLAMGGSLLLFGFWVFVYNIARSLLPARPWDITERHFAIALGYFFLLTILGFLLALTVAEINVIGELPVGYGPIRSAHLTLAVFGAILTTIYGALYQLSTMFTQSEVTRIDTILQHVEEGTYPIGVFLLAIGRLLDAWAVAMIGGVLVIVGTLAAGTFLARRLIGARVAWTPMLSRYVVVVLALGIWLLGTAPAWAVEPLGHTARLGVPGSVSTVAIGVIGFVVFGTLYHVIPFIVWVHRYSDELGLTEVPMIDDLYDDRIARADFIFLVAGTGTVMTAEVVAMESIVTLGGLTGLLIGAVLFVANMGLVLRRHSPHSVGSLVIGRPST